MGTTIDFPTSNGPGRGYLAEADAADSPGVVIIQEWWGLVPHIEHVCDRFAAAGFLALAPDLYHGKASTEPDEAAKLMMAMRLEEASREVSGAIDELRRRSGQDHVGVVGFCMGGGLALLVASERPDAVGAVVPFYGAIPWPDANPNYRAIRAAVLGHYAGNDDWASAEVVANLEAELRAGGNEDVTIYTYTGTEHAFFNDDRPEVYDATASSLAFERTVGFLHSRLA